MVPPQNNKIFEWHSEVGRGPPQNAYKIWCYSEVELGPPQNGSTSAYHRGRGWIIGCSTQYFSDMNFDRLS